jgi:ABC-type spermidine/putrescine transport system permease subunit II
MLENLFNWNKVWLVAQAVALGVFLASLTRRMRRQYRTLGYFSSLLPIGGLGFMGGVAIAAFLDTNGLWEEYWWKVVVDVVTAQVVFVGLWYSLKLPFFLFRITGQAKQQNEMERMAG